MQGGTCTRWSSVTNVATLMSAHTTKRRPFVKAATGTFRRGWEWIKPAANGKPGRYPNNVGRAAPYIPSLRDSGEVRRSGTGSLRSCSLTTTPIPSDENRVG